MTPRTYVWAAAGLCLLVCGAITRADDAKPSSPYFEQTVRDFDPLRTEQAQELNDYILALKADETRLNKLLPSDFSSPEAYEKSAQRYRQAFCDSIDYPPPGDVPQVEATFEKMGEDSLGTYYRVKIPILPKVHSEGIYIVPNGLPPNGKAPLIISMHGGGGSPEVALFNGGTNYHDMVRGGVKRGYVVYAPQHLFKAEGFPGDIRQKTDERLRLVGTSITAVEIAKITRALDVLLKRPEIDATRAGMVGLSYGGFYTLLTAAIEPRIKVAVCSCYFGAQEVRYGRDELSIQSDLRFANRFSLFRDENVAALVCPRALQIQAGSRDGDHTEGGKLTAPKSARFYSKLGLSDRFEHRVFDGGHEFNDESAWEFVKKQL